MHATNELALLPKMFESTGWHLEEYDERDPKALRCHRTLTTVKASTDEDEQDCLEIVQQYQFSSSLQRMSVIAKLPREDNRLLGFTKGSPEMVLSLSKADSIPRDVATTLEYYTEQGYRVIAVACKNIEVELEQVLCF